MTTVTTATVTDGFTFHTEVESTTSGKVREFSEVKTRLDDRTQYVGMSMTPAQAREKAAALIAAADAAEKA